MRCPEFDSWSSFLKKEDTIVNNTGMSVLASFLTLLITAVFLLNVHSLQKLVLTNSSTEEGEMENPRSFHFCKNLNCLEVRFISDYLISYII